MLRDLMPGPKRFGELMKSIDGISHKVLTDNLRGMKRDGLIVRRKIAQEPQWHEYELTSLGASMRPILQELEIWFSAHMPPPEE